MQFLFSSNYDCFFAFVDWPHALWVAVDWVFTAVTKKPQINSFKWHTNISVSCNIFLFLRQGVEIVNDDLGNVWATGGSKNDIFVKERTYSDFSSI